MSHNDTLKRSPGWSPADVATAKMLPVAIRIIELGKELPPETGTQFSSLHSLVASARAVLSELGWEEIHQRPAE